MIGKIMILQSRKLFHSHTAVDTHLGFPADAAEPSHDGKK